MRLLLTFLALGIWSSSALADPRDRDYRRNEVREIQERLVELDYAKGRNFEVDGVFGDQTREALRDFQRDHHLHPADGEAGPATLEALFGEGPKSPLPNSRQVPTANRSRSPRPAMLGRSRAGLCASPRKTGEKKCAPGSARNGPIMRMHASV